MSKTLANVIPLPGKGKTYSEKHYKKELNKVFHKDHVKGIKKYTTDLLKKAGYSKKYKQAIKRTKKK